MIECMADLSPVLQLAADADVTFYEFLSEGLRWAWAAIAAIFMLTALVLTTDFVAGDHHFDEWFPFFLVGAGIMLLTTAEFWISVPWVLLLVELLMVFIVCGLYVVMLANIYFDDDGPPIPGTFPR